MLIDGKRALAYVVTIDEIKPIEGYDRVEYARTNGWWCIISKADEIKVGDKCVYFEVDSKANAEDERFAFLDKRHYKIKTQKMCKGKSAVNPKVKREGVVIRNPKDDFSFKNVSREYLLKHNQ